MKLKCRINEIEYDIVNGATFSEEYNETLDSGNIIITGVERLTNLRPFDDVFIYNADAEFKGYKSRNYFFTEVHTTSNSNRTITINGEELRKIWANGFNRESLYLQYYEGGVAKKSLFSLKSTDGENFEIAKYGVATYYVLTRNSDDDYIFDYGTNFGYETASFEFFTFRSNMPSVEMPSFYRHLLVDTFTEERLNPIENLFKYKISLFSETKRLERVQLPNISITQPLNISKRRSVADYITKFVREYTPTIKIATSSDTWMYSNKYEVDSSINTIFGNVYCPNFSLDNPSLRDLLNQLFLVKDCIPYVKDDVIYALDITKRNGNFNFSGVTNVTGSRSSDNHSTGLKRTYNNALSSRRTVRNVEYLGFRNSSSGLLTLSNMRLETKFPIYKINKIYMCYYKRAQIWEQNSSSYTGKDKIFLCKQDITKLVRMKEEEATLSKDWNEFEATEPTTIDELAQYRLCTVDYTIGSNIIDGWGTSYEYPSGWWGNQTATKTYIENIFKILDKYYPYGIYTVGYLSKELGDGKYITVNQSITYQMDNVVTPISDVEIPKKLKTFFFIVDYEGFYNGTVYTSKDENRDDIDINDNQGNSLTLLEKDGLFQKEKANRFGNMAYTYNAVYDDVSSVQPLGSVDNSLDEDVIIYHRAYSIFDTHVQAEYYGSKDYVLKNYFTSVYAKHRPFNLLSFEQSTKRSENRKQFLLLSRDKVYYEMINSEYNLNPPMFFDKFSNYLSKLMTFCKGSETPSSIDRFKNDDKINYGYVTFGNNKYASDINVFVSGYSLCFNISMWDNISMGKYIEELQPTLSGNVQDDLTGSVQSYYPVIDDIETGFTQTLGFYLAHTPEEEFKDTVFDYSIDSGTTLYEKLLKLPLLNATNETNVIGKEYLINKDNKEAIDMTFQIEAISEGCIISEWFFKLCDLYGGYNKWAQNKLVKDVTGYLKSYQCYCGSCFNPRTAGADDPQYLPLMIFKIPIADFNNLSAGDVISAEFSWSSPFYVALNWPPIQQVLVGMDVTLDRVVEVDANSVTFHAFTVETYQNGWWGGTYTTPVETTIRLEIITQLAQIDFSSDTSHYYLSSVENRTPALQYYPFKMVSNSIKWGYYYANTNTFITDNTSSFVINTNCRSIDFKLANPNTTSKMYYKNIFIKTKTEETDKTLVYNEYAESDFTKEAYDIGDIIQIYQDIYERRFLRINLNSLNNLSTLKSIEVWYCEREDDAQLNTGTMHFVFGVNITDADKTKGYIDIYASMLTKKDGRVFTKENEVIGETKNYIDAIDYGDFQKYVLQ